MEIFLPIKKLNSVTDMNKFIIKALKTQDSKYAFIYTVIYKLI